jgi:hypothetical protein
MKRVIRYRVNMGPRKPVHLITDRAKRYRAQHPAVRPLAPKQCGFCGSTKKTMVGHINGRESDGDPANLIWTCRSCNGKVGAVLRRARIGSKTHQYNPAGRGRRELMKEYGAAIKVMRGEWEGDVSKAVATVRGTPREIRSAYTARTWPVRRQMYGPSGRQGGLFGDEVPF